MRRAAPRADEREDASTRSREDLLRESEVGASNADEERKPDYNVAHTKTAPVVVTRQPQEADDDDAEPVRQLRNLNWGLLPNLALSPQFE
jgi:putative SOS response-associated peptidase YedK